jgi:WD40 repeat protein/beta-lactamase regulating signal transducer with metallopeptidase domain
MTLLETFQAAGAWAGVILVQMTLIACLGVLAWLSTRRGGPALRGAVLLATLIGLVAVPALGAIAPVWLPLPESFLLSATPAPPPDLGVAVSPTPSSDPAEFTVLVKTEPAEPLAPDDPKRLLGTVAPPVKAEATVIEMTGPVDNPPPVVEPVVPATSSRSSSWSPIAILSAVWLLGAVVLGLRALVRLALLYRCVWRARPVDAEVGGALLSAVSIRESASINSPITLGVLRPVILLPTGWRNWPVAERALILKHELAHVQRRDFLAGLMGEAVLCLCWFHPLVRWLVGQLRLEQEYAADAWVATAESNATDYVCCLARLALKQVRGRGSLAPSFWRRRPEILRRIDMLRRNPGGVPVRLGKWTAAAVAVLTATVCLAIAGVAPLRSAPIEAAPDETTPEVKAPTTDVHGDPLPAGVLARLGTTRLRHDEGDVTYVAFGQDGKTLISAGRDNTIRLWDLSSGKEIRRFARPTPVAPKPPDKGEKPEKEDIDPKKVVMQLMMGGGGGAKSLTIAVAPGGKTLAAANGNVVQLWEIDSGKELRKIELSNGSVAGMLFSHDGERLAARTNDGTLLVWSVETGKEQHQIKPAPEPKQDGLVIVFGGGDDTPPPGLDFTPDGKALAAAATDYKKDEPIHSIKFWDLGSGKELRRIEIPGNAEVSSVAVAPGGKTLAYGAGDVVHLCAADTGKDIHELKAPGGAATLIFSPDGKTLAVQGRNQRVHLWDTDSGKEVRQLGGVERVPQAGGGLFFAGGGNGPESRAFAFSADGKQIASAVSGTIHLWDTESGKEVSPRDGPSRAPTAIIVATDGKSVFALGSDRIIRRWDAATGKSLGTFQAPEGTTFATFSTDGRLVALANADETIRVHDVATGKELHRIKGHKGGVTALAFTADGKILASRGRTDNTIRLVDVAKGQELRTMLPRPDSTPPPEGAVFIIGGQRRAPRGTGPGLLFSSDGSLLIASASKGNGSLSKALVIFDTATGKELRRIESSQPVASFALSPDGRTLAAEHPDRTITLWEVASGKEWSRFGKPAEEKPQGNGGGMVFSVAVDGMPTEVNDPAGAIGVSFSPDGRALASRGPNHLVRLWDVAAAKELDQLKGHSGRVETIAFAPDGKTIASGSADTTILLWDAGKSKKGLSEPQTSDITAEEAEALWRDLGGDDAAKAIQGVHKLALAPRQAVPLLGEHLKPAARADGKKVDGWIADLESETFAVREDAYANLLKVGAQGVPALRKVLASSPPLETRKRVEELVERLTDGTLSAEQLRVVRAVEVLERMGTPEAKRVLRTLADGAPGELSTQEAKSALGRMSARR